MISKRMRALIGLTALSLMFTLSGCSAGEGSTSEELSGELTVYTSQPEADIQALVEKFNESEPDITVNIFRSGTEEVVSKVLAEKEADSLLADVLLVADAGTFESLKEKDMLMSYESPELEGISSDFYDDEHTYTGTKIISTGIIVNTDLVKTEVKSFKDLLGSEFKDSVIMPSPLYSGAAAYNLGVLTRTDNIGWEYYEALKENGIKVDKGNGSVLKAVVPGEKAAGIIIDYMVIRAKDEGAHVEFVYPEEGSLMVTEPIAIVKGTDEEKLAKAFVDFILSEEGQAATSEIGYTPIKSGIAAPEGFRSADEIEVLDYDLDVLVPNRSADKERFSEMFN